MELYINSRSAMGAAPWNPNLQIISEKVLGDTLYTMPDEGSINGNRSVEAIQLAAILMQEHATYTKYKKKWADALNWYNGDENIVNYISRHPRELQSNYNQRRARAYYWNYTDSILNLLASFIYSKTITRSMSDKSSTQAKQYIEELQEFWKNVDRLGTNADEFFQNVLLYSLVFDLAYVMVDKPRDPTTNVEPGIQLSEQARKELGLTPYLYTIPTMNLTNWHLNKDGTFLWARWYSDLDVDISPFGMPSQNTVRRYTTWSGDEWWIHDVIQPKKGRPYAVFVDMGPNPLGEVPIVRFIAKRDLIDPNWGRSMGYMIGKINVAILNYLSLLDEDLYGKCLNLLAIQVDDISQNQIQDPNAPPPQNPLALGSHNVLEYSSMAQPPFYLSPSSNPGELLITHIANCTDQIYRIALFGNMSGPKSPYSEKSGLAYGYEFNETNRALADKSYAQERGEIQVCRLWAKWMQLDATGVGFLIDYPQDFQVSVLSQELNDILLGKQVVTSSETFEKELQKRAVRRFIDEDQSQTLETINKEIDANAKSPMQEKEEAREEMEEAMQDRSDNTENETDTENEE